MPTDPLITEVRNLGGKNSPTPVKFSKVAKGNGFQRTADWLAIWDYDDFVGAHPQTVQAGYYIARCGHGECVLMKHMKGSSVQEDFFTTHKQMFGNCVQKKVVSKANPQEILGFKLMNWAMKAEQGLAHLMVATTAIHQALDIDQPYPKVMPATAKTHADDSRPFFVKNTDNSGNNYKFGRRGQIEIDLVVTGKKGGKQQVFVIEAKSDAGRTDIANWKFLYQATLLWAAIGPAQRNNIDIIPAYMYLKETNGKYTCEIATFEPVSSNTVNLVKPKMTHSASVYLNAI